MKTTSKMSLRVWNNLEDDFDHEQLADNWAKVDAHDHTPGRGVQLASESIANGQIKEANLAEELIDRIFTGTEKYTTEEAATEAKPYSVEGRSLVFASFKTNGTGKATIKLSGQGSLPVLEPGIEGQYVATFYVADGETWEWKKSAGTWSVKFRTAEI